MESITSIDALCVEVKRRVTDRKICVIGIDGMDGVGKTSIGRKIAQHLNARLISLDDYLEKERGTYVAHLNCAEISLRAATARCEISVDFYIYVRLINSSGRWNDKDICLSCESPEVLKKRERELRQSADQLLFSGNSDRDEDLRDELIDYHYLYSRVTSSLRVCPETSGWIAEFSEHEAD